MYFVISYFLSILLQFVWSCNLLALPIKPCLFFMCITLLKMQQNLLLVWSMVIGVCCLMNVECSAKFLNRNFWKALSPRSASKHHIIAYCMFSCRRKCSLEEKPSECAYSVELKLMKHCVAFPRHVYKHNWTRIHTHTVLLTNSDLVHDGGKSLSLLHFSLCPSMFLRT